MDTRKLVGTLIALCLLALVVWYFVARASFLEYALSKSRSQSANTEPGNMELRERGTALLHGINCPIDKAAAEQMFRQAYENGDKLAGGQLYMILRDKPNNPEQWKSVKALWDEYKWHVATEAYHGNPEARYLWCMRNHSFANENPDVVRSIREELPEACRSGYPPALYMRGYLLNKGSVWDKDLDEATRWFRATHEAGCTRGTGGMGIVYSQQDYSGYDPQLALDFLRQAGNRGHDWALLRLGDMHAAGLGIEPDPPLAREYYRRSAESGSTFAMIKLSLMLMRGEGGDIDLPQARSYLDAALSYGDSGRNQDALAELEKLEDGNK
ncbi:MAG: tetratricopeptide repeat protein [bacterium]